MRLEEARVRKETTKSRRGDRIIDDKAQDDERRKRRERERKVDRATVAVRRKTGWDIIRGEEPERQTVLNMSARPGR